MLNYEELQIFHNDRKAMEKLDELLLKEGISRDGNLEHTLGIYDGDELIATGSIYKNTLRCLAVASSHQGEGLMNRVVSRLIDLEAQRGIFELFIYTKCDKTNVFRDLGFFEICRVEGLAAFMENRRDGFQVYLNRLAAARMDGGTSAAIVMNANPFTLGHRYLVERAAAENDRVHLFVVSEEASLIPFSARYALVEEGVLDIPNVLLHQTGSYMISSATFPSYFIKDAPGVISAQARLDLQIFKKIAGVLNIGVRYVGEEPFSQVTGIYNNIMAEELTKEHIRCIVVPRKQADGKAISASTVRDLIHRDQLEEIEFLVPSSTFRYFHTPDGREVVRKIQAAADIIHY